MRCVDDFRAAKGVVPFSRNFSARGDINDFRRYRLTVRIYPAIADDIIRVDIGDGLINELVFEENVNALVTYTIIGWHSDTLCVPCRDPIDI